MLFSKSTGLKQASATSHGCLVILARFNTASNRVSFLGVHPSECQKYTENTLIPPLAFTQAWVILPSLPGIDAISPSFSPTTAPRSLSTAVKTPPDVRLRSSLPAVSSVILASAANHHPSLASLLNCSSISSFLNLCPIAKKISHFPFVYSHVLPLCAPRCQPMLGNENNGAEGWQRTPCFFGLDVLGSVKGKFRVVLGKCAGRRIRPPCRICLWYVRRN